VKHVPPQYEESSSNPTRFGKVLQFFDVNAWRMADTSDMSAG